jgi:hypothetical protein
MVKEHFDHVYLAYVTTCLQRTLNFVNHGSA